MTEIAHRRRMVTRFEMNWTCAVEGAGPPRRVVAVAILAQAVEYFDFFVFATASAIFLGPAVLFATERDGCHSRLICDLRCWLCGPSPWRSSRRTLRRPLWPQTCSRSVKPSHGSEYVWSSASCRPPAAIGWAAPTILIALRILQGFALGGQWGGASLLLTESSPASRRGFYGSFVQVGAQLGLIGGLSSYLVLSLALSDQQMMSWGWRIPFLSGIVMVAIGLYIHRAIEDTPMFRRLQAKRASSQTGATRSRLCADRPRHQDSLANHSSRRWRIRPPECGRVHHRFGRAELRGPDSRTPPG